MARLLSPRPAARADGPPRRRWWRGRAWGNLQDLYETSERPSTPWLRAPLPAQGDTPVPHADPPPPAARNRPRPRIAPWRSAPAPRVGAERIEQRSLFGEILDFMFAPLLLLWPLSVAMTFLVARTLADAPYDRALDDRTVALAQQVRATADQVLINLPRAAKDFLAPHEDDVVYYQVVDASGVVVAGQPDLPRPRLYDFPRPGEVTLRTVQYQGIQIRIGYLYLEVEDDGTPEGAVGVLESGPSFTPASLQDPESPDRPPSGTALRVAGGQIATGPVLVQLAETLDKRTRLANEIIKGVIFPQFIILPLAGLLVWFGLSRGLAPLQSLQRRIRDRAPDDLSPIDPRGAPEEIAPLVDAFNDLLERLGQNVETQKRFIADAAHQMKTPLAGLRTQSELALRETDPAELRRALEQIARGSERAGNLISQLLSLARTENLRESTALTPLDLAQLARAVVTDWVPAAMARRLDLGFEVHRAQDDGTGLEAAPVISGHPILLRELMNNLVDNALRYTPQGGTVTVRVVADSPDVRIEVEDSGPGIPEGDRELVFERFYRVLGTDVDGSGLGLAIVREIADQHCALVRAEPATPGRYLPGTRVTVTFPLRSPTAA